MNRQELLDRIDLLYEEYHTPTDDEDAVTKQAVIDAQTLLALWSDEELEGLDLVVGVGGDICFDWYHGKNVLSAHLNGDRLIYAYLVGKQNGHGETSAIEGNLCIIKTVLANFFKGE